MSRVTQEVIEALALDWIRNIREGLPDGWHREVDWSEPIVEIREQIGCAPEDYFLCYGRIPPAEFAKLNGRVEAAVVNQALAMAGPRAPTIEEIEALLRVFCRRTISGLVREWHGHPCDVTPRDKKLRTFLLEAGLTEAAIDRVWDFTQRVIMQILPPTSR